MNLVDIYCKDNEMRFKFWATHPITIGDLFRFCEDNNLRLEIVDRQFKSNDSALVAETIVYRSR